MSRLIYYISSIATILTQIDDPFKIVAIFLGVSRLLPAEISLRKTGWRFKVRSAMDIWIVKETCLDEEYAWGFAIGPDWQVIDIGAGIGDFSIWAASQCPEGRVYAYEPLPESFSLLEQNLVLNGVENVNVYNLAATASGGQLALDETQRRTLATSTRLVQASGNNEFQSVSLAQILDQLPGDCDFVKIDCEGCEYDLLINSSADTLSRIRRMTLEYHEGYSNRGKTELVERLRLNGFKVETRKNPVHDYLGLIYAER